MPSGASAVGWYANGRFTGDFDITFNSATLDTGASANDLFSIQGESATTITVTIGGTVYTQSDFV